ncbi:MAG: class I SAM-dependent methyltransferase, partial [Yoonia sp.]
MTVYDVASLWIGPELSWMEQICLESFLWNGHRTILYLYEDVASVPDGVEVRDARDIMPSDEIIYHVNTGSPAFHSDVFRLRLLDQVDCLWIDTDAYCLKPFIRRDHGFFFGWGSDRRRIIFSGILGLPKDSRTLRSMLELTKDEYPVPPWASKKRQAELQSLKDNGKGVHMSLMPWGVCGPEALHYFSHETGEVEHAFDGPVLYPVPFSSTRSFHRPHICKGVYNAITEETLSVHLYGRRFRN